MVDKSQIILVIGAGFLTIMLKTGFIIVFIVLYQRRQINEEKKLAEIQKQYQQGLLATALDSEEAERRRIAQDLHDDVGVLLSLTKMSINQMHQQWKKKYPEEEQAVGKARSLLEETILHVRKITRELVPTTLEQFGLEAAIEEFAGRIEGVDAPKLFLEEGPELLPRQPQKVELALFRIVQELVNNAIKHAKCSEIHIHISRHFDKVELHIWDNGIGFDAEGMMRQGSGGLGLRNIESRLSIIRGTVKYIALKPGSRAEISVPIINIVPEPDTGNA